MSVIHRNQRQIEDLTRLNRLSLSVVEVLDADEVLARIVNEATRMLQVETGSVLLLDSAGEELWFAISISNGKRIVISNRLKVNQGIAGRVVTTGKPACVRDVINDPDWFGEVETGFVTRSILCVPLHLKGRTIGVLQVLNKKGNRGFVPGDTAMLSAFAASATIAIENARLFEEARQVHQLRALNTLALTLGSTLDLHTILSTALNSTLEMLNAQVGSISLIPYEADTSHSAEALTLYRGLSNDNPQRARQQRQLLDQCLSLVCMRMCREPLLVDPVHEPEAWHGLHSLPDGMGVMVVAPLKMGTAVSGVLTVMRTVGQGSTPDMLSVMDSIARIIELSVQNATHYHREQAQTRHLTYLNEIGSVLTRSLDLTHILQVIVEGVNDLLETERTSVFLIDENTDELVLRYSNEGPADIRLPAPWQGIAGWVATHDAPALVNDTHSDPRHLRQVAQQLGYEAHSILCVPLKVEGSVIGVVEVLNKRGDKPFTHHHQQLLSELTQWAAIALHNARLFEERVQAYERLAAEQQRRIAAETRGAMAAVILDIGHTMNNIIGAIRAWALTLEHEPGAGFRPELSRNVAGNIRQNAEEAIELIRTMRGPLEQAVVDATDVHACLEDAIKSCWWPGGIELCRRYQPDVPLVCANRVRLEAVFQNIISNAIQAMATCTGTIEIATYTTVQGWVRIDISDNGPGIPIEIQEQLFMPGISTKDGSLGIGLWLVETFVRQFGGEVGWSSTVSEGTTFAITLPPMEV